MFRHTTKGNHERNQNKHGKEITGKKSRARITMKQSR